MQWEIQIQGKTITVSEEQTKEMDIISTGPNRWHMLWNNQSYSLMLLSHDAEEKKISLRVNDRILELSYRSETDVLLQKLGFSATAGKKANQLKSPMPGLVVDIRVKAGDRVAAGDPVIVLEAMKMENLLKAPADALVKKIAVEMKQSVEKGQLLIEFGE